MRRTSDHRSAHRTRRGIGVGGCLIATRISGVIGQ
ncbi:hypothetical protein FHR81_000849 [Actinoalloteichus hoggarensis]|nr:hypothetical protein [Actinoalloteichus hoggarensis]